MKIYYSAQTVIPKIKKEVQIWPDNTSTNLIIIQYMPMVCGTLLLIASFGGKILILTDVYSELLDCFCPRCSEWNHSELLGCFRYAQLLVCLENGRGVPSEVELGISANESGATHVENSFETCCEISLEIYKIGRHYGHPQMNQVFLKRYV